MKLAFVFPGQGSQSVGMLNGFGDNAAVASAMKVASDALDQDLVALIANGPEEALARTINTQPLMLAADVAFYRAWLAAGGPTPSVMAGHSLGEYAALCAAGGIALGDATKLVRFRAEAMQSAVPEGVGAMAAILGLSDADVIASCAQAQQSEICEAVNFNAPSQVVIAGHRSAVERAIEIAKTKGAKRGVLLPVSAPFHSSLLLPAAENLGRYLSKTALFTPQVLVLHNVDVSYAGAPDAIRAALSKQAASAVRWGETIQKMAQSGVTHIIECGPGKVLAGLTKRIAPELQMLSLNDNASLEASLHAVITAA